jgi:hypothetical protein
MTFLVTLWIASVIGLLVMFVGALAGVTSRHAGKHLSRGVPVGWWDLLVLTYQDTISAAVDLWHAFLPYIHNGITAILARLLASRDRVYAKLFGYPAVPQGGVVSFFLKRIVAHKEEFRQKMEERQALYDEIPEEQEKEKYQFSDLKPEK